MQHLNFEEKRTLLKARRANTRWSVTFSLLPGAMNVLFEVFHYYNI